MSTPVLPPDPRAGSGCISRAGHQPFPPARLPGIGVGATPQMLPAMPTTALSRYRVREDRPGLNLRAGELALCAVYEPAALGMVVVVRCESDGYAPGALLSLRDLELIEHTGMPARTVVWSVPGVRD